ncbi:MAG TPA: hypothetical protein VMG59_08525 [Phycisphaerae bacterium]|nr:hypothetical protein [Phycisphaerae bacterium]
MNEPQKPAPTPQPNIKPVKVGAKKKTPTHRRRWPWIVGGTALLLILIILALPSLLCTGPGVRFIESEIDSRIKGQVQIDRLTLGWFSPIAVEGLSLRGPSGEMIISGLNLDTQLSLLRLATNRQNLRKMELSIDNIDLQSQGNGNLNLLDALAGKSSVQTQTPPAGQPSQPTAASPTTLAPIAVELDCNIKNFSFSAPNAPQLNAENVILNAGADTSGVQPVAAHLSAAIGVESAPPTQIVVDANLKIFNHFQLLPMEQIAGGVTGKIDGLDLSVLEPVLATEGIGLNCAGKLTLDMSTTLASEPQAGQIKGTVGISGLVLSGALLKGDNAKIGDVQIPIDASWGLGSFSINQLALNSSLVDVSVSGSGSPEAINAALHRLSGVSAAAQLKIASTVQLANLFDTFPNLSSSWISAIGLPANTHFSGGATKTTAQITLGGSATSETPSQATLPQASGTLQISGQPLVWSLPDQSISQQASLNCQLAFDTSGKPIQIQLQINSGQEQSSPMQLSLTGDLTALADQNILPLKQWNGPMELKIERFILPDLTQFNMPIVPSGILDADINMNAQPGGKGGISGQLTVDQTALSGSMLKTDQPQFGTVVFPVDVDWNGDNLTINQLGFKNPAATVIVSGTTSISALQAMKQPGGDWGMTDIKLHGVYDLGALCADLPHVLGLSESGLKINSGTEDVNMEFANAGVKTKCAITSDLTDLAGQWQQRQFNIDPIYAQAAFARSGLTWSIEGIKLNQGDNPYELTLQITPISNQSQSYTLECQANAAKLCAQIGKIVDLNGASVIGQLDWKTQLNDIFSPSIGYSTAFNFDNVRIVPSAGQMPINEPQIIFNAKGDVDMTDGVFNGFTSNFNYSSSVTSLAPSQIQLQLDAKRNLQIPELELNISNLSFARLTELLTPMIKHMGRYNINGQMSNSVVDASYTSGAVNISKVHLAATNLNISSTNPSLSSVQFKEPSLTLDLAGTLQNGATKQINFSTLNFTTADNVLHIAAPQPVTVTEADQGGLVVSCPNITIGGDLSKLAPLLIVTGKLSPQDKLQGNLAFTGSITQEGKIITLGIDGTVNNYQLQNPLSQLNLPPTNLFASLNGQWDMSADAFRVLKDSQIGERAVDGSGSNQITLDQGTTVSWAPGAQESVHATVSYDLARLQLLLAPLLPSGMTMSGRHSVDIQITGALTQDPGIRMLRSLTINPMGPAFDQIVIDGVTLGPGSIMIDEQKGVITLEPVSIPANGGSVNLAGYIDLNQTQPALYINEPLAVLQNVQFDSRLGESLLDFLPVAWGGGQSTVTVTGHANLQIQQAYLPLEYKALKKDGTLNGTVSIDKLSSNSPIFSIINHLIHPLGLVSGGTVQLSNSGISPTNFELKNGKVSYQNMQVTLSTFGLELTGWVALDDTMHMDVSATGVGIVLPIPLAIDGTTSQPKVKLSAQSLRKSIEQVPNILNNILGH